MAFRRWANRSVPGIVVAVVLLTAACSAAEARRTAGSRMVTFVNRVQQTIWVAASPARLIRTPRCDQHVHLYGRV
jgi:hypothetical protein